MLCHVLKLTASYLRYRIRLTTRSLRECFAIDSVWLVDTLWPLFPEGTIVGCSPSVIGFKKEVYGQGYAVEDFWPERQLEVDEQEKSIMERRSMNFGAGKRMCLDKHISLLEIHRLVALLLTRLKVTTFPLKVICLLINFKSLDKPSLCRAKLDSLEWFIRPPKGPSSTPRTSMVYKGLLAELCRWYRLITPAEEPWFYSDIQVLDDVQLRFLLLCVSRDSIITRPHKLLFFPAQW